MITAEEIQLYAAAAAAFGATVLTVAYYVDRTTYRRGRHVVDPEDDLGRLARLLPPDFQRRPLPPPSPAAGLPLPAVRVDGPQIEVTR